MYYIDARHAENVLSCLLRLSRLFKSILDYVGAHTYLQAFREPETGELFSSFAAEKTSEMVEATCMYAALELLLVTGKGI